MSLMWGFRGTLGILVIAGTVFAEDVISTSGLEHADAALERALRLDAGEEDSRNRTEAARLYEAAATGGIAVAHFRLGYLYEVGDGVPVDTTRARAHYEAAVASGLQEARLRLAICHLQGWGGPVDRPSFLREVVAAADSGLRSAQLMMASLHFSGFVAEKDYAKALAWLERAAKQDDPEAQLQIGRHLERKQVNELMPDLSLARAWYELSAEQEYAAAMRAAGLSFLAGNRGDREWDLAHQWLTLATDTGDSEAPFILAAWALLHPAGQSIAAAQVNTWLETARDRGNHKAEEVLKMAEAGRTPQEAMRYLHIRSYEDRYVENLKLKVDTATDRHPRAVRIVRPYYPQSLRLLKEGGSATVEFVVDVEGNVRDVQLFEATHPLFGDAAIAAVAQWKFEPALRHGRPVNTRMRVPSNFNPEQTGTALEDMLSAAHQAALKLGGQAAADAVDLMGAENVVAPPEPITSNGQPIPPGCSALILLVLDEHGTPQRGHVLEAEPIAIGQPVLDAAMRGTYETRTRSGRSLPTNVVLPFLVPKGGSADRLPKQ